MDSFSPSIFSSSRNFLFWRSSIAITPSRTKKVLPTPEGRKHSIGSSPLTSSLSMINIFTLHHSSGSHSSPDISFSLALSCSWEVPQDLGSDHLLILLTVPLSLRSTSYFSSTSVLHPSSFKKAH